MRSLKLFALIILVPLKVSANAGLLYKTGSLITKMAPFVSPALYTAQLYKHATDFEKLQVANVDNDRFARKTLQKARFPNEFIENLIIKEEEDLRCKEIIMKKALLVSGIFLAFFSQRTEPMVAKNLSNYAKFNHYACWFLLYAIFYT